MSNEEQIEYWNDNAGEKWAEHQAALDAMLAPATSVLIEAAAIQPGERVLDIGCGTGETSLIAVEAGAQVTGVDVSEPMLELARSRADGRAQLLLADASEYQSDTVFDLIMSRFGVMFFEDPAAAFANIRKNLKPDGRMVFACWQSPKVNDWVMVPMKAIKPLMPEAPETDPYAPGPFAFADSERLDGILQTAGFENIEITAHVVDVCLTQSGGVDGAVDFSSQIGPASRALGEVDETLRPKLLAALKEGLAPHDKDGRVTLPGGIWLVKASAAN
ncbi:methyltransferase domain-containing protein [Parasphingorhabdus sp.]|uniref:class I SAM-dependent methyltransferase n=1 Tax=Parasphingorhabdus sp. TaxID=2709688 RepID=UPI003264F1EB